MTGPTTALRQNPCQGLCRWLPAPAGGSSRADVRPDTARPDTARPDTARPDTGLPDTARPDTGRSDAVERDRFACCGCGSEWDRSQRWTPIDRDGTVPQQVAAQARSPSI
jgi:hypothetical protein